MKLRDRLSAALRAFRSGVNASTSWGGISWDDWVRGNVDVAPGALNERSARSVSTVVACINLIAGSIGSMPMHLYRRVGDDGREPYKDDLWWLLNERPWQGWSAIAMWEFLVKSRLLHGDGFARIHRASTKSNVIVGIEPWHPDRVDPRTTSDGRTVYVLTPDNGPQKVIDSVDMIHVSGDGFDGRRSLSALQYGLRYSAGIAAAADSLVAAVMKDGARPDFAIEIPGTLTAEQREVMRQTFRERNSGQSSSRTPIVIAGGAKLHQLTLSAKDAELLASRSYQVEEICRVFGVPPHMVGHVEKTTSWGAGIEEMTTGFLKFTLMRHIRAIEQEFNHKLFRTSRNFCEFVTAGLERGQTKHRYEAYRIALGRAGEPGWMLPSEVRRMENLPEDPDIDAAARSQATVEADDAAARSQT